MVEEAIKTINHNESRSLSTKLFKPLCEEMCSEHKHYFCTQK
jgi:hypothetical protein